jgi:hypothetical protein
MLLHFAGVAIQKDILEGELGLPITGSVYLLICLKALWFSWCQITEEFNSEPAALFPRKTIILALGMGAWH